MDVAQAQKEWGEEGKPMKVILSDSSLLLQSLLISLLDVSHSSDSERLLLRNELIKENQTLSK